MVRLKHPSVLAVTMPLAESKDTLAFATEQVFASLAGDANPCLIALAPPILEMASQKDLEHRPLLFC
jgi:hypothetical protein